MVKSRTDLRPVGAFNFSELDAPWLLIAVVGLIFIFLATGDRDT